MLFDDNIGFITYDFYKNIPTNNDSKLVSVDEGFLRGNMFADEYKPYKNYSITKIIPESRKEELLLEIMELTFAIVDLNLYLDLHPNDEKMLSKFKNLVEKSCQKEMEYVQKYGPLELIDNDECETFEWIKDPWPWENTGGTKYV